MLACKRQVNSTEVAFLVRHKAVVFLAKRIEVTASLVGLEEATLRAVHMRLVGAATALLIFMNLL